MNPQRSICPNCDYILARCLCPFLSKVANQTELIILQHPSEVKHALNTVKIMTKSFQNLRLFVGENFNEFSELQALIKDKQAALIFPSNKAEVLTEEEMQFKHLIFIDASWNKAKKIYHTTTLLHQLPSFKLSVEEKSQYRIRASGIKDSLSTLEAVLSALSIVEHSLTTESVKESFLKMIDFQIEKMGSETYQKNYLKKE